MAAAAVTERTTRMDEQEDREPVDALLQLLSDEVVQRLALAHWDPAATATASATTATTVAAAASTAVDESALAASVFEAAKGWPRTHRHFHRLDALLLDEHEPHDARALESALRRLKRVQQPPSPTAGAAAAVPSSAAPRAALPAPSSPSSSSFLSSFFAATPAHPRPLDGLAELCAALNSHTNSSTTASSPEETLRALAGLEDVGAAELVHATTDQWQLLLAALQRCCQYRCDLGPSQGRTTAQATAAAPSKSTARSAIVTSSSSSKQKTGATKKKDGKSTTAAAAARPAPSSSAAAPTPAVGTRQKTDEASAVDATLSSFLLSSRATMLLQELHDASDGSVQSVDIFIALLRAMKDTVVASAASAAIATNKPLPDNNSSNNNSDAHSVRWFALLPTDMASLQQHALDSGLTATITAATDSRPPPMLLHQLLLRTLLFHQARLLGQLAHALVPELWLYANKEVQHAVADAAADFWITTIALAHGDVGSSGSNNDGSCDNSRGDSINRVLWTMVCMPDVRFQWFRRWMAQHPVRALFHASVARHRLWLRAHAALQRLAGEQALELVDHPFRATIAARSSSTMSDAAVLSISTTEAASLGRSAALSFLLEFAVSWLPTPPSRSVTTTAAAAPVASSSKGARGKKAESKPAQSTSAAASSAAVVRVDLLPLVELCVAMLAGSVLFAASASTDASNASAISPSLLPLSLLPLQTRARLTALSSAAHFLTHALQRTDLFGGEGNKEVRTQKMTSLWRTLLSAVDALLRPPHSFAARHVRTMVDDQFARWRSNDSARKSGSVNGSARDATQKQPEEQQQSLQLGLEQQASLTAIIGLAISFVQHGSASASLLLAVRLDVTKADEQKQQGEGLLEPLCRALSIDGDDTTNNSDAAARRFFQFGDSDSGPTPTAAAGIVRVPQVLESMLLELLELCLPPLPALPLPALPLPQPDDDGDAAAAATIAEATCTTASADRASFARPLSDLRFLRHMATKLSHIAATVTPSQQPQQHVPAVATGGAVVTDDNDDGEDDEALAAQRGAHQQSALVAAWMDVLLHWASLVDGAWSALQVSHPAVVLLCCQRVVLLLRSGVARSPCLPWCTGCRNQMKSAPASAQHDSNGNGDDDDDPDPWTPSIGVLHFVVPVLSSLVKSSNNSDRDSDGGGVGGGVSAVFRDSVVRAGLVHGILAQLGRLVAQSDDSAPHHWQLAFDLAASSPSPPQPQPHSLWPLQLSIILLGNEAALQMMEHEAVLLSSGSNHSNCSSGTRPSKASGFPSSSSFPSALRPPLFLRLSQLVHAWVLQEEFVEDEDDSERGGALSDGEPTQTSARRSFTQLSALPLQLPLSFPLSFGRPVSPPPSSSQRRLPASWFGPLPVWLRAVASTCDAHEVGVRLLVGVLSGSSSGSGSGSDFAGAMHRWWNLHALLQQQQRAHFDGIEDAATPWRKRLLQLLLTARQQA